MPKSSTAAQAKQSTTAAVFKYLYRSKKPLTKQEVAAGVGTSLPTVYQAFGKLEDMRLLHASPERKTTGGRRAAAYELNATDHVAIGISATGTKLQVLLCDLYGSLVEGSVVEHALPAEYSKEELASLIASYAGEAEEKAGDLGAQVIGVGIAVPSSIDPSDEHLCNTRVLRLGGIEARASDLSTQLELPSGVFVDAICGALAQNFPNHANKSIIYLSLEHGVGGAALIGSKPLLGDHGMGALFGHICVDAQGAPCSCGKRGCLEVCCSSSRLSDDFGLTLSEFFEQVDAGEDEPNRALDTYLHHLARGIQTLHTVFDCEIALGGAVAEHLAPYLPQLEELVEQITPFAPTGNHAILASHPTHASAMGAAQNMIERYIKTL